MKAKCITQITLQAAYTFYGFAQSCINDASYKNWIKTQ